MLRVTPPPKPTGRQITEMEWRRRAVEKTAAKFKNKSKVLGKSDCLLLIRYHLIALGYPGIPTPPKYSDLKGAIRALKSQGDARTLSDLVDQHLPRIAPAMMRMGDVALVEAADEAFGGALTISLGHKLLGWHPDQKELAVIDPNPGVIKVAWRV